MNNSVEYLEFAGIAYSLDFSAFDALLSVEIKPNDEKLTETETTVEYDMNMKSIGTTVVTREYQRGKEIDMSKYEMVRFMLEIVLGYNEEIDDSLGVQRALDGLPISYKIAFNTLIKYGILKEIK